MSLDRRDLLKLAAGASVLAEGPRALAKALAVAPNAASGTLNDVEHVVILMQENRSASTTTTGSMRGVRGLRRSSAAHPVWGPAGTSVHAARPARRPARGFPAAVPRRTAKPRSTVR